MLSASEDQIAIIYSKTKQVLKIPVKDISGVQASELSVAKSFAIPSAILLAIPVLVLALLLGASWFIKTITLYSTSTL